MANQHPARRLIFLMVGALAMVTLLLAAACGDDDDTSSDDDDDNDATPTMTMDAGDNGDGNGDGGDDDDNGDGNGDDNGDSDVLEDLEDIADNLEGATGVVTYTLTSSDDVDTGGTWTLYSDGGNSRFDVESDGGGFISITTPEASYVCSSDADSSGICFSGEGTGTITNPFLPIFAQYGSADAIFGYLGLFTDVDVSDSSETIAGVDAECYTASGDFGTDSGTIKWCFASNGVLLLSLYELDGSTFGMEATAYSDTVPAGSFEPPYDVQNFNQ